MNPTTVRQFIGRISESVYVGIGMYISYGALFFVGVWIGRQEGVDELGRYTLATAFAQITIQSSTQAFSFLIRKDVSLNPEDTLSLTGRYMLYKIFTSIIFSCIVILITVTVTKVENDWSLFYAIPFAVVATALDAYGMTYLESLQALGHNKLYSLVLSAGGVLLVVLVLLSSLFGGGLNGIYISLVLSKILFFAIAHNVFNRQLGKILFDKSIEYAKSVFAKTIPIFANSIVFALSSRISVLIIASIVSAEQLGIYSMAISIVSGFSIFPVAVGSVYYSSLCVMYENNDNKLTRLIVKISVIMCIIGTLLSYLTFTLSSYVVKIYGNMPAGSGYVLSIAALGLIPIYSWSVAGFALPAFGKNKISLAISLVQLVVSAICIGIATITGGVRGGALANVAVQAATLFAGLGIVIMIAKRGNSNANCVTT